MKHARVRYQDQTFLATEADGKQLRLADGRLVAQDDVTWLPPIEPRTVFTLAINYADHAKELAFKAPEEPLGFLKGANTFIGHKQHTMRPDDVTYMHYECELVAVIGATARNVRAADAYDYIAGYTVANDYALRDYLENWYRPNLRVKSRDTCTPLGPWFVDRDDIADPMNLKLRTTVNGKVTQEGNTRDMVFGIPALVEYFSSFMTLQPGDIILTGTPDGIVDTRPGDEIVTEVEGVGRLVNTIISEADYLARGR